MTEQIQGNPENVTRYIERFLDDDSMRQRLQAILAGRNGADTYTIHGARHQIDSDFCNLKDSETPWKRNSIERIARLGRIANLDAPSQADVDAYFDMVKRYDIQ